MRRVRLPSGACSRCITASTARADHRALAVCHQNWGTFTPIRNLKADDGSLLATLACLAWPVGASDRPVAWLFAVIDALWAARPGAALAFLAITAKLMQQALGKCQAGEQPKPINMDGPFQKRFGASLMHMPHGLSLFKLAGFECKFTPDASGALQRHIVGATDARGWSSGG